MLSPTSPSFPEWFAAESLYCKCIAGEKRLARKSETCCIFGHENITPIGEFLRGYPMLCLPKNRRSLKASLKKKLRSYIAKCGINRFLLSWGGAFTKIAADTLAELRAEHFEFEAEIWIPCDMPLSDRHKAPGPHIPEGFPHHFLPASQSKLQLFLMTLSENGLFYDVTRHWWDAYYVSVHLLDNTTCMNLAIRRSILKQLDED